MAKTIVTSSGSGIAKVYPGQPMMSIDEALYVFDLNKDSEEALEKLCDGTKWNTVIIYQLQKYSDVKEFGAALRKLIKYVIFTNQSLLESMVVVTKMPEYTEVANKIWPEEQRSITKFRGRKWPNSNFVKEFATNDGSGSVSVSPDKLDMNDILSWFYELQYEEQITNDYSGSFDDTAETEEKGLPIPLEDDAYITSGTFTTETEPTAHYYYYHEYTIYNIQESHAMPCNNMTQAFLIPQNSVIVDVCKMDHVEIVIPPSPDPEGGDSGSSE